MQSKVSVVTWMFFNIFAYTLAQCQLKMPMDNFSPELVDGKFYLVANKKAFPYQYKEARCGTSFIDDASLQYFPYIVTFQNSIGTPQMLVLSLKNLPPPGTYNVSGGDGTKFQSVVLGAIQRKVHIFYACNPQNNKEAVWVYYSSRVAEINNMDIVSQQYVRKILSNNNIPINDLWDIDNNNCNN